MSRMQEKKDQPYDDAVFVGIDVGKQYLDVYFHPIDKKDRITNDNAGIRQLIKQCKRTPVHLIAIEATGKYHALAHRVLSEAGFDVAVINPYRSRKFADALGQLAKTDKIDACILAKYAALIQPSPTKLPSLEQKMLRDLTVARRQVVDEHADLQRQLGTTDNPFVLKQMRARIKMCARHQEALEIEMQQIIKKSEVLKRRFDIITSIPGIGSITATALLTELEELGIANCREIAALCGLAPMNRDSGIYRGVRSIRGGRAYVRQMLYMCAVCQSRRDNHMGKYYRRLIANGKKPKVALIALARKLVILANTLISEDRQWQTETPA